MRKHLMTLDSYSQDEIEALIPEDGVLPLDFANKTDIPEEDRYWTLRNASSPKECLLAACDLALKALERLPNADLRSVRATEITKLYLQDSVSVEYLHDVEPTSFRAMQEAKTACENIKKERDQGGLPETRYKEAQTTLNAQRAANLIVRTALFEADPFLKGFEKVESKGAYAILRTQKEVLSVFLSKALTATVEDDNDWWRLPIQALAQVRENLGNPVKYDPELLAKLKGETA